MINQKRNKIIKKPKKPIMKRKLKIMISENLPKTIMKKLITINLLLMKNFIKIFWKNQIYLLIMLIELMLNQMVIVILDALLYSFIIMRMNISGFVNK